MRTPDTADVMGQTPDPAIREMVKYMDEQGVENCFDRFDKQKPHCTFGLTGFCCRTCSLGPFRITERALRGTFGANADLDRRPKSGARGVAAQGAREREVMLTMKNACTRRKSSRTVDFALNIELTSLNWAPLAP